MPSATVQQEQRQQADNSGEQAAAASSTHDASAERVAPDEGDEDDREENSETADKNTQSRNRLAEAIERGGITGWGSYLVFAWAMPLLRLGASRTLKEDDLEGIYHTHKRLVNEVHRRSCVVSGGLVLRLIIFEFFAACLVDDDTERPL